MGFLMRCVIVMAVLSAVAVIFSVIELKNHRHRNAIFIIGGLIAVYTIAYFTLVYFITSM